MRAPATLLAAALAAAASSPGEPRVTIGTGGGRAEVELAAAAGSELGPRVRSLVDSCSLKSIDHPYAFAGHDPDAAWTEATGQAHLRARFARPFAVAGRTVKEPMVLAEVLVPLRVEGPYWLARRGTIVVELTKCHGRQVLDVLCSPAVRPYLATAERAGCRL